MRKSLLFVLIALLSIGAKAQTPSDALLLLRKVNVKYAKVKDYSADVLINTRISFLKILPQRAKVYFKTPDKFKVKAKGIAILPKQNFDQLFRLIADEKSFMAFVSGTESINQINVVMVNVIPTADTSDLVLAKIWIDPVRNLIIKSQLTTKSNGTVLIDYQYGSFAEFALPDKMVFTVDVKKFKIPKAIAADINTSSTPKPGAKEPKTGQIIISFSKYLVNLGVADAYFKN